MSELCLRLDSALKKKVRIEAAHLEVSMNQFVIDVLEEYFDDSNDSGDSGDRNDVGDSSDSGDRKVKPKQEEENENQFFEDDQWWRKDEDGDFIGDESGDVWEGPIPKRVAG